MSRRVRNWCDVCRDLEPDIACTAPGCEKKFHLDCLQNAALWRPDEDSRTDYVCSECRESSSNDTFCYICRREIVPAKSKGRKRPASGASKASGPPLRRPRLAADVSPGTAAESSRSPAASEEVGRTATESSTPSESESGPHAASVTTAKGLRRSRRQARVREAEAAAEAMTDGEGGGTVSGRLTKADLSARDDFVLCDGCSNSAHLHCLGLDHPPQLDSEEQLWFCTECDPHSATAEVLAKQEKERRAVAAAASRSQGAVARSRLAGGNVDICYVCQKGGKLLGCDFCEQAFHPRCIDAEFLEFETVQVLTEPPTPESPGVGFQKSPKAVPVVAQEKWRCPICKGEDPLENMAHKRMSRTAMLKMSQQWQECIRTTHRTCRANRDRFLWQSRRAIEPFVTIQAMNRLRKQFAPHTVVSTRGKGSKVAGRRGGSTRRGLRSRVAGDSDETDEDEEQTQYDVEIKALRTYRRAERSAKRKGGHGLLKEGVNLKSYQMLGVGWLVNSFHEKAGAILADEMGLGKTIQCLGFLSALLAEGITGPHLIVVPLSTVGNWAREIRKFVPHMKFVKICGSRFEREHTMQDTIATSGLYDLYITTYETVVTEEAFFCDNFNWQCLILDEAHRIKNESGRIRHSLDRVAANMRVLLTGTPLQNNVRELFTLLNFLFPDVLRDSEAFERAFQKKDGSSRVGEPAGSQSVEEVLDERVIDAVVKLLGKMMMRRTKDLVVRLPRKVEHDIWVPLSPLAAWWYRKLLDASENAFQQQSVRKLLGTVVKMRVACCHPRGLVTRDAQLKRFKEVFEGLEGEDEIERQANLMLDLEGEPHILASNKLVVLDKLLTQLHAQNLRVSPIYAYDYVQNVKDLWVQAHPPEPIPMLAKSPRALKDATPVRGNQSRTAAEDGSVAEPSPVIGEAASQMPPASASSFLPSGGPASAPPASQAEAPFSSQLLAVPRGGPSGKPLTARQQSDRLRKQRAALIAQQQIELDRQLEKVGEEALQKFVPSAKDPDFLLEFMMPATVSDAPLPELPVDEHEDDEALSAEEHEEADDEDGDGDATESEGEVEEKSKAETVTDGYVKRDAANIETGTAAKRLQIEPQTEQLSISIKQDRDGAVGEPQSEPAVKTEANEVFTPAAKPVSRIEPVPLSAEPVTTAVAEHFPHKVLVFTQFQLALDELERYCRYRGFRYLRLDGSTNKMIRELDIREFNDPGSTHLVYLICTRAGGVGINLVTANHVVLYDEDWNPFIDLQAIDRAHRIGQRRDVHVWKLVTEWTVEERMAFRRMQKLKLDKLLIQAAKSREEQQILADEEEAAQDEDHQNVGDKFSIEEIRRLIKHGRTAIQRMLTDSEGAGLEAMSLEDILCRERRTLPVVPEADPEEIEELPVDESAESRGPRLSIHDVMDPEDKAVVLGTGPDPTVCESRTVSTGAEDIAGGIPSEGETEDREQRKISRRLRRRIPMAQAPAVQEAAKPKVERKIIHDKRCYRCGSGVNVADEAADPLVPCHRCPRVYHRQGCLSMEELPKRTWTCAWHECCLCFRKGSQAGGLLIHCAECPTTFCFDCFPPEYRRYTPPVAYYADLTKRGYPCTPEKLVLFLCSRCKALKEQQRRRLLSRQQLEQEARKRRETQLKAKAEAQKAKEAATGEKPSPSAAGAEAKKMFQNRKKQIDDADKENLVELRTQYERLFPPEFTELCKQKKAKQQETKQAEAAEKAEAAAAEVKTGEDGSQSAAPKSGAFSSKAVTAKTPAEFFKLCENCHLPGHESTSCPFPAESEKKRLGGEAAVEEDKPAEKLRGTAKRLVRSFCPKCGVSTRNHFRRHCDQLTEEEQKEYADRRAKTTALVQQMKQAEPVSHPCCKDLSFATLEGCRRALQKRADEVVRQLLVAVGLEQCVVTPPQKVTAPRAPKSVPGATPDGQAVTKPPRRRRKLEGTETAETAGDSDVSYSPRKKSRVETGLSGDESPIVVPDIIEDVRAMQPPAEQRLNRRGQPRPDFRELNGGEEPISHPPAEEEKLIAAPPPSKRRSVSGPGAKPIERRVSGDLQVHLDLDAEEYLAATGGDQVAAAAARRHPATVPPSKPGATLQPSSKQQRVPSSSSRGSASSAPRDSGSSKVRPMREPTAVPLVPPGMSPLLQAAASNAAAGLSRLPPSRWAHHPSPLSGPPRAGAPAVHPHQMAAQMALGISPWMAPPAFLPPGAGGAMGPYVFPGMPAGVWPGGGSTSAAAAAAYEWAAQTGFPPQMFGAVQSRMPPPSGHSEGTGAGHPYGGTVPGRPSGGQQ